MINSAGNGAAAVNIGVLSPAVPPPMMAISVSI
jgi:hypothetical protein